jgi:hypothetical protein
MDTQQVLELLLARMDADREERKTDKEYFLAKMDANQEKAEADRKADQEKVEADRKIDKEERKAAQVKADARNDEDDGRQARKGGQQPQGDGCRNQTGQRHGRDGLPRDGGMSRRRRADHNGNET